MENELKQYELICILSPHMERAELDTFKLDLEKNIDQLGGKIIHFKEEGKRNLAYPINKQNQGIYLIGHIEISPTKIADFFMGLKLNNQILRHIINYLELFEERERPKIIKKISKIKIPSFASKKTVASGDKENIKLEEIDKKLDELVGL